MTTLTFDAAVALLAAARTPTEVFGAENPAAAYRQLAKIVHPDVAPSGEASTRAFARLAELWAEHRRGPTLTTRRRTYSVGEVVASGDVADLVAVSSVEGRGLWKLARDPADNDLVVREAHALRQLAERGEERHRAYVPRLVERFTHRAAGVDRAANIITRLDGFCSLAQVARAYPDGVDARDAAWMWRRLLVAIGFAHRAGVIHGAVLPEHVLIHPAEHGLALVDWCYATTEEGETIPAMVSRYAAWYPPEVAARIAPTPATDIYLATRCMTHLMGTQAPPELLRFARGCTLPSPAARPKDAWRLLGELDDVLAARYGRRVFRPFRVPGSTPA